MEAIFSWSASITTMISCTRTSRRRSSFMTRASLQPQKKRCFLAEAPRGPGGGPGAGPGREIHRAALSRRRKSRIWLETASRKSPGNAACPKGVDYSTRVLPSRAASPLGKTSRGPDEESRVNDTNAGPGVTPRRRWSQHARIFLGLSTGGALGVTANLTLGDDERLRAVVSNVAIPAGQIFLRLIFMVVIPLVVSALILGVAELGDPRRLGRVGL